MGDFVKVAETKDIQPSKMMTVEVDGEKVCVGNVEGKYYAIGNVYTHMSGPLAEGKLEGNVVQCPWHGSRFDITSGKWYIRAIISVLRIWLNSCALFTPP
jgi:nitrite reductase (NADH) small subunit/3-phenylpropionate/trans-cinnamate dioxygenase ferredoxin subunit